MSSLYSFINQEGLVMTRLKELGRSGNYIHWNSTWLRLWISSFPTWRNVFKLFLSLFNQSNACLELRDGDQAEFLSRRLEQCEQTLRVLHQRLTETCPRQDAIRAAYERSKAVVSAGFRTERRWYILNAQSLFILFRLILSIGTPLDLRLVILNIRCFGWTTTKWFQNIPPRCEEIHSRGHVEFQST